jgi:aspartyl-tRNA(Asn)/glutamyl-tRNA(Gln) amidotransferase subunit A
VEDTAVVLNVICGKDELDSTTIDRDDSAYDNLETNLSGKKIGIVKEYFEEGLEPGIKKTMDEALEKFKKAGAVLEEVSMPSLPLALAVYYIICPAEVSSNLARYDGQRYGYSDLDAKDLNESYILSRSNGFGAEAKRRIMIGAHVLSSGFYDAYYKKAQTVRTKIIKEFEEAFKKYDFLLGPTSPGVAFEIGAKTHDPLQMYLTDIMTVAANISGNPAISIPTGESGGLPIGLQLIAAHREDRALLGAAKGYEALA